MRARRRANCCRARVLKADFHTHSAEDPVDCIPYDARALVDRAAALSYSTLAITLHDRQLNVGSLAAYARERGVVLIPGIERTICGKHVLLLDFPAAAAEAVATFDDLRRLKARAGGLVVAPHPFFPTGSCLGRLLDVWPDLFDAVELNAFYTRALDFNRRAVAWARKHGKPVVGNGDVHRLHQLDTTFTLVEAAPEADAVCDAVRRGAVEIRTRPLGTVAAAAHIADLLAADWTGALRSVAAQRGGRAPAPRRGGAPGSVNGQAGGGDPVAIAGSGEGGDGDGRHLVAARAHRPQRL